MSSALLRALQAPPDAGWPGLMGLDGLGQENKVACQSVVCDGALCSVDEFQIEYDQLIVGVGELLLGSG
jgi:hypothetical protein